MVTHKRAVAALALLTFLPIALPRTVAAQQVESDLLQYQEVVSVGIVLVPVTVRSKSDFINDLNVDDFELQVEGRTVAIESFDRGASLPLDLVMLQDLSGSMAVGGKLAISREFVQCLIGGAWSGDRFALASFADRRTVVDVPFTQDLEALQEAIGTWKAYGLTALHDAVARLPEIDPDPGHPHRAAVLLTDGSENASALEPEVAREMVRQADLPVFVVDVAGSHRERQLPNNVAGEGSLAKNSQLLRQLATATGGRYISLDTLDEAVIACAELTTELRSQYLLGFSTLGEGDSRYRTIKVLIPKKGLRYSARAGYIGLPPAPAPRDKIH